MFAQFHKKFSLPAEITGIFLSSHSWNPDGGPLLLSAENPPFWLKWNSTNSPTHPHTGLQFSGEKTKTKQKNTSVDQFRPAPSSTWFSWLTSSGPVPSSQLDMVLSSSSWVLKQLAAGNFQLVIAGFYSWVHLHMLIKPNTYLWSKFAKAGDFTS